MSNFTLKPVRRGYVESAMQMVRDCHSGDPSRHLFCILSHVIGSMSAILLPTIIVVGLLGNIIVAHVMLNRLRPLTRQNLYLGCIAIADILSLIVIGVFNGFLTKGLPWLTRGQYGFFSYNLSDAMCKVSRYALNFCHVLSCVWLLVLVTDRVLVVHRPLAMKKFGLRWAGKALAGTLLLSAVIALPNGILTGHVAVTMQDGSILIYCYHLHETQLFMLGYTTAMSNPPLLFILLMLFLNGFLLSRVVAAVRKRRALRNLSDSNRRDGSRKEVSGTVIVLILAILYLLLHAPLLVSRPLIEVSLFLLDVADNLDYLTLLANLFYSSMVISLVNQSLTFFVLMRRSRPFRQCVSVMFCRVRNRRSARSRSSLELGTLSGAAL